MKTSAKEDRPRFFDGSRFFKNRLWYGGLIPGLFIGFIIAVLGLVVFAPRAQQPKVATATSGDITITMDDALMTTLMKYALLQEQSSIPFTIQDVAVVTHKGDEVQLTADGPSLLGQPVTMKLVIGPVASKGKLTFNILETDISILVVPGFLDSLLEDAMNAQVADFGTGAINPNLNYEVEGVSTTNAGLSITAKVISH